MRAFYTDPYGFQANLCLMADRASTRVIVRAPEGNVIYTGYYPTWEDAVTGLRDMLPGCINDLTGSAL